MTCKRTFLIPYHITTPLLSVCFSYDILLSVSPTSERDSSLRFYSIFSKSRKHPPGSHIAPSSSSRSCCKFIFPRRLTLVILCVTCFTLTLIFMTLISCQNITSVRAVILCVICSLIDLKHFVRCLHNGDQSIFIDIINVWRTSYSLENKQLT